MAKERKASVIYEGNASQLVYAFPFDYLRKKFVKVEDIYTNITELTIGVDYTVEDKQVRLVKGIPVGHFVKIYRKTTTDPLVEWQDASVLRSDDLSLQEVQLLHLAEEALDIAQDKGLTTDDNDGVWDARYNKIKNLLEPTEAGDAVNLGYITKNQDSLLNKLNSTGEAQNKSIVATGDAQNARLTTTGEAQNTRLLTTGDNKNKILEDTGDAQNARLVTTGNEQNSRLTATGTNQNERLTETGKAYVSTMTTLKDTVVTKASEANSSADLAKKWAVSTDSPDGKAESKSSKTWAEEAMASASSAASSASKAKESADSSASSASKAAQTLAQIGTSVQDAANSAAEASHSATEAASSATAAANSLANIGTHEANAAASAAAAKDSADRAATWDPTSYTKTIKVTKPDNGGNKVLILLEEIQDYDTYNYHRCGGSFSIYPYVRAGANHQLDFPPTLCALSLPYDHTDNSGYEGWTTKSTYIPLVVKNTATNKVYWGISTSGSGHTVIMFGAFEHNISVIDTLLSNSKEDVYDGYTILHKADVISLASTDYVDALKPNMLIDNAALYNHMHRLGSNKVLPDGNSENFDLGIFSSYYDKANVFAHQPTTYGQLINIPARKEWGTQLWIDYSGKMFYRGAAAVENINEKEFNRFLDSDDRSDILAAMPSKLSQLTNDANYATTTDVSTAVEKSATTIKAQIPKATSQLTNDSGYATTESVDNKIGAIWDEPLDWDTIESTTIMDGTAIIYNNSNIPARFRLQLLYDIFKRDTDTQLDNYVLKTDYSQEAQKWKDAYNNLRKRSTPTAFDDDELTVLMNTPIGRGTITLSQPYTDFDGLLIDFSDDTGALLNSKYISTAELNRRIARAKDIGISSIFLLSEYYYWAILITERNGFSTTTFPNSGENCQIKCIYGVKLKEIT